ncbi:MAG TPA: NAD(P)H-binding protein, partial [Candidatus Eremiobacteraceae bacterium]|nr:NAD(P)H-binding protein [Candidatus Eremiobacteraceae bacterium]
MYVIVGATGNTGSVVAENLLARGEKVRGIGRDKEKLARLAAKGAETAAGELTDAAFLAKAFEGARAVYFMVPPNPMSNDYRAFQREVIEA